MAELTGKVVSELAQATDLNDSDLFAISQSGASKSLLFSLLKDKVLDLKLYTKPTQLGLSGDSITLLEIFNAMPGYSIFMGSPGYDGIAEYATAGAAANGVVLIYKRSASRNFALNSYGTVGSTTVELWLTHFYSSTTDASNIDSISAWRKVFHSGASVPISNGGTGATTAAEAASALGLAYKAGDTISARLHCYGFITGSGQSMRLYCPMGKTARFVSGFDIATLTMALRKPSGGYIQSSAFNPVDDENTTVSVDFANDNGVLRFVLVKTDGWGETNNSTFNGEIDVTGTFT